MTDASPEDRGMDDALPGDGSSGRGWPGAASMGDDVDWARALEAWSAEPDGAWVTVGEAERRAGVSKSALRSWYRSGQLPSRLVDGPHGVQRLVPLDAVAKRASQSPRIQRRLAGGLGLEAELELLRRQVEDLERRLRRLEGER